MDFGMFHNETTELQGSVARVLNGSRTAAFIRVILKGPKWLSSGEHQLNITLNTQLHRRADAEDAKRFSLVKDN